jgi:hypothetical protein
MPLVVIYKTMYNIGKATTYHPTPSAPSHRAKGLKKIEKLKIITNELHTNYSQ